MLKNKISEYRTWQGMKQRCYNKKHPSYKDYGGRGIIVCKEWINSYDTFIEDMGNKPTKKHTIERIDNSKDYDKENCKWATKIEQSTNRRSSNFITHDGKTLTAAEWSRQTGIDYMTIRNRVKNGWSHEKAITTPVKKDLDYTQKDIIQKLYDIGVSIKDIAYIAKTHESSIYRILNTK
jgi:DNA-directed RNA polymerase specialized sigma subunit